MLNGEYDPGTYALTYAHFKQYIQINGKTAPPILTITDGAKNGTGDHIVWWGTPVYQSDPGNAEYLIATIEQSFPPAANIAKRFSFEFQMFQIAAPEIADTQAAIDRLVDALADGSTSAAITKKIGDKEKSLERAKEKLKKLTLASAEKNHIAEKLPTSLVAIQENDVSEIEENIISGADIELRLTTSRHLHKILEG